MITYITEGTNNKLHLFKMDNMRDGVTAYLDASRVIKDAEHADVKAGYKHGGPRVGCEIEHARQYAEYVEQHATADNLYCFYCNNYFLFTDRTT